MTPTEVRKAAVEVMSAAGFTSAPTPDGLRSTARTRLHRAFEIEVQRGVNVGGRARRSGPHYRVRYDLNVRVAHTASPVGSTRQGHHATAEEDIPLVINTICENATALSKTGQVAWVDFSTERRSGGVDTETIIRFTVETVMQAEAPT